MINNSEEKNKSLNTTDNRTTTGHDWDGIQEYNTPAPRWWLIVWIICIIWSFIYWFFYPTWPTLSGNSKGIKNWTTQSELKVEQGKIKKAQNVYLEKFSKASFSEIKKNKDLMEFALTGGKIAFKDNCAACHGAGAAGGKGFPNLNDDDWIWGGKIEDIYTTLKYGIRSIHNKTRSSQMPSFGLDQVLTKSQISDVTEHVLSLSGKSPVNPNGKAIFKANCAVCHGNDGKGNRSLGAPNLTDAIWLYGGKQEDIIYTVYNARYGVMPSWDGRLDDNTIKSLAIYVHSLGGGE